MAKSKKIRKIVRLYRQHDLDLYYLGLSKSFHLGREMKRALVAYANEWPYEPPTIPDKVEDTVVRTSMFLILYFDPNKPEEQKALDLLKNVKYGYGCPFLKSLFRSYLETTPLKAYFTENGLQMTNKEVIRDIQKKQSKAILNNLQVSQPEETDHLQATHLENNKEDAFEKEAPQLKEVQMPEMDPFSDTSFQTKESESSPEEASLWGEDTQNEVSVEERGYEEPHQEETINFQDLFAQANLLTH